MNYDNNMCVWSSLQIIVKTYTVVNEKMLRTTKRQNDGLVIKGDQISLSCVQLCWTLKEYVWHWKQSVKNWLSNKRKKTIKKSYSKSHSLRPLRFVKAFSLFPTCICTKNVSAEIMWIIRHINNNNKRKITAKNSEIIYYM